MERNATCSECPKWDNTLKRPNGLRYCPTTRDHVADDEDQCNPQKIIRLKTENARLRKVVEAARKHAYAYDYVCQSKAFEELDKLLQDMGLNSFPSDGNGFQVDPEALANEIREFMLKHQLWQDTKIYFNGKAYSTSDGHGNFYYNDPDHLVVLENQDPRKWLDYVANDHILSMSFEGPLYDILNFGEDPETYEGFNRIFEKHGVRYVLGDQWNLTCYPRELDEGAKGDDK